MLGGPGMLSGDQIDEARTRAAKLGCDRAISGDMISVCAALNADIARMQDNLERPHAPPSADTRRERVRILDAMELAGCHDPDAEDQEAESPYVAPAEQDFGGTIIRGGSTESVETGSGYPQRIVVGRTGPQSMGEYRTLCVRTCDGYTFPLSSTATVSDFQRDQKSCEAGCPGTEVELFYHLADGETQDDMVSARSGQPYRKLPTAYRYKRTDLPRVPACGCNIGQNQNSNFSIIAGDGRPVPSAPVTTPTIERPAPEASGPSAIPAPDRKVRAVGPTFLPDRQGAIDLQAPAPTQGR
ncbi:DUF2865 domain-containing protein [Mesorhizobium sp. ANAO-SY3R2]|uniref:DUF2865 domain-containing protein n=1 Tax=Mesorhizobium sp. ANAO-SY3R2 TaxID=3166644 RepID=UPI00366E5396